MTNPQKPTRSELSRIFNGDQRLIIAFERLFETVPSNTDSLNVLVDELNNQLGTTDSKANSTLSEIEELKPTIQDQDILSGCNDSKINNLIELVNKLDNKDELNFFFVSELADLPPVHTSVINLLDNATYYFTKTVDLEGARILAGPNTTILGSSSENCKIISTGLTDALITSNYTIPIRHITLEATKVFNLDATGNSGQAIDWYGVNIQNTSDIGLIKNYNNVIMNAGALLNASGLVFDGTIGTIAFNDSIAVSTGSGSIIELPSTLTVTRRFRSIYSAFVVLSGGTGIDASATIPADSYILDTCNFSGSGTYLSGYNYTDNEALFIKNIGINNTSFLSSYYMNDNATVTTISTIDTPVKVAGTTIAVSINQKFTHTNNRLTYTGAIEKSFKIIGVSSFISGNNNVIGFNFFKNGTIINSNLSKATANSSGRAENITFQTITNLSENDYIEVYVQNKSGTQNITVEDLNVIIEGI